MKKIIISLGFSLGIVCFYGQDYYMYVGGQKRVFEISETKMFVKSDTLNAAKVRNEFQKNSTSNLKNTYDRAMQLTMVEMQNTSRKSMSDLQKEWNNREDVVYASPIFVDKNGKEIGGFTNQILIRLKSVADYPLLESSLSSYNIKTIEQNRFDERAYTLTLGKDTVKNTMQIAGELYETGLFANAEPNLLLFFKFSGYPKLCLNHDFNKIYKISKINPVHLENLVKIMVQNENEDKNIKKFLSPAHNIQKQTPLTCLESKNYV